MGSHINDAAGQNYVLAGDGPVAPLLEASVGSPRKCRDMLPFLAFIACNCGAIFLSTKAYTNGNLNRIRYGISDLDQVCSQPSSDGNVESAVGRPNLLYCRGGSLPSSIGKVCVKTCPGSRDELGAMWDDGSSHFKHDLQAVFGLGYTRNNAINLCTFASKPVLHRCFIDFKNLPNGTGLVDYADSWQLEQYINDVQQSWLIVLGCGIVLALVTSWCMLMLMKACAGVVVWVSLLMFSTCMITLTLYSAALAGMIHVDIDGYGTGLTTHMEEHNQESLKCLTYVLIAMTVMVMLMTGYLRTRINLAIGIIREAVDIMRDIPMLIFVPIPTWFTIALLTCASTLTAQSHALDTPLPSYKQASYVFLSCALYSTGFIAEGELQVDSDLRKSLVYVVLWYLWVVFFAQAYSATVTAGSVSQWYWARDKQNVKSPICMAAYNTLRYHLGSLAFGSGLLAVMKFIRHAFMWYTRRMKKLSRKSRVARCLLCCTNYCLWYVEKILQFLTRSAYIWMSMSGEAFCPSARKSFTVIAGNAARFLAVSVVSSFIVFISTMITVCVSCIACFVILSNVARYGPEGDQAVSSPFLPVLMVGVASFLVAHNFNAVFEMTIDTVFLCFSKDEKENARDGNIRATERLQRFMHHSFRKGKSFGE